jgi:NADH-quinone oxidoreductase subunit J
MLSFAGLYAIQDAPFLAAVQVIVYTGAVLMLFLFVLMLVGVDSSDSLVETLRGQRVLSLLVGLGFAGVLGGAIISATRDLQPVGLERANERGNVFAIAELLFTRYLVAFEVTSALLITAALGAMVLTHTQRLVPLVSQRERARLRFSGERRPALPGPGVFAGHASTATPALLPDGSEAPESVADTLQDSTPGQGADALGGSSGASSSGASSSGEGAVRS